MTTKQTIRTMALLACLLMGLTASAYDFMVDGLCYNYNSDGTSVTVTGEYESGGYSSDLSGDVVIPSAVSNGGTTYSVTSIHSYAFYCCGPTSVIIPNSVTSIGSNAFYYCKGLTSVTIPNSVTSIGDEAFEGTPWLANQPDGLVYAGLLALRYKGTMPSETSIVIKEGTIGIAGGCFSGCNGLTSVTIPGSVTTIGGSAFASCSGLTSVAIPNSVTKIGGSAFKGCSGLTSVAIPGSVTTIGGSAFASCSGLTSVAIPNSVTSIGTSTFSDCSGLISVTISNSVTSIGSRAFQNCSSLYSVTIPSSVTSIGSSAYSNCTGIKSLEWNAINCPTNGGMTTANIEQVVIGDEVKTLPQNFARGSKITSVSIPNSVTSIGVSAFASCTGLTSMTIPGSVTSIGDYAFSGCSGLTSMTIPGSVTTIGAYAFASCSGLTSVAIPGSVTTIGVSAFASCSGLTSVTIPNSVTTIGGSAFKGCTGLTDIYSEISNPTTRTTASNAFEGVPYTTCKLHIPAETKHMYQVTTPWNNFENIIEGEGKDPCDINGDGVVDIFDVNAVINRMLGVE